MMISSVKPLLKNNAILFWTKNNYLSFQTSTNKRPSTALVSFISFYQSRSHWLVPTAFYFTFLLSGMSSLSFHSAFSSYWKSNLHSWNQDSNLIIQYLFSPCDHCIKFALTWTFFFQALFQADTMDILSILSYNLFKFFHCIRPISAPEVQSTDLQVGK